MTTTDPDLTTYARIRNSALELFAARGVKATTIRTIADHAGVSPGLVQHHYGTKAKLRETVDAFVLDLAAQALGDLPGADDVAARSAVFGTRMAAIARDHPDTLRYVARSVGEGDEAGLRLFKGFAELGREALRALEEAGAVGPEIDLDWLALHLVVFNLGSLLFEPGITRVLGEPFLSDAGLERWNAAATTLFTRALRR